MNKIQIKAEILTLITKLQTSTSNSENLFEVLDAEQDKKAIMKILLKELSRAKEQKAFVICYMLTRLFSKEDLKESLNEFIKEQKISDYAKMVALNLLKDLGIEIQEDLVKQHFEDYEEIIDEETKELLNTAIMNPEAQIDFMDFVTSLPENEKEILITSLSNDYEGDALANILTPVFLYNPEAGLSKKVINMLSETKSQLAFHALEEMKDYVSEDIKPVLKKGLSTLKLAGVRVDNTLDFYKEVLKNTKPYKSYISFPDGQGNNAIVFSRKRDDETLQFIAIVINDKYGILDCFGFNEIREEDFDRIVNRFFGESESVEISANNLKYLIDNAEEISRINKDVLPYEYVCWKNILLDIMPVELKCSQVSKELSEKDIESVEASEIVQHWFYDINTSEEFNSIIKKLNKKMIEDKFSTDLETFIELNFASLFNIEEVDLWNKRINLTSAFLEMLGKNEEARILLSIQDNKEFMKNILRKSIYEYYISQRWYLNNSSKTRDIFKKDKQKEEHGLELMQVDMIISSIENLWVKG